MPHCEGSKDQCIKYQFFRPLHIFSVFQCCKHLDILATFVPVWASISCVCIILWVGEIAQTNGFNSARIIFYPIPQKISFLGYWKATSRVRKEIWISQMIPPGWLLQKETLWKALRSTCIWVSRLCACDWREDMAFHARKDSGSLFSV